MTRTSTVFLLGSALTGAGILIRARCYTMFKRLQPGHWFVLIFSLNSILQLILWPFYKLLSGGGPEAMWVYLASSTVIGSLTLAAYVCAIVLLHDAKRWRILFGAKTLGEGTAVAMYAVGLVVALCSRQGYPSGMLFSNSMQGCSSIGSAVILVMLLVVVALDLPRRSSRDWLHWLGVGTFALTYAISIAWEVFYTFFYRLIQ